MIPIVIVAALTLLLGALADAATGVVARLTRRGEGWVGPLARMGRDLGLLVRERERIAPIEGVGVALAVGGSTIAVAAVIGLVGGSLALIGLALIAAAAGGHLALAAPRTVAGARRSMRSRLDLALAEPAFLVALAVPFLRWHTADAEAIRGAHEVLGPGLTVGTAASVGGLGLGLAVLLIAGALRLPPDPGEEAGAHGGPAAAASLARWSIAGSTALVAASLAWGAGAVRFWPSTPEHLTVLGLGAAGAVALGAARSAREILGPRARLPAASLCAVLAAVAVLLVRGA